MLKKIRKWKKQYRYLKIGNKEFYEMFSKKESFAYYIFRHIFWTGVVFFTGDANTKNIFRRKCFYKYNF
jgi:hypothetical protein